MKFGFVGPAYTGRAKSLDAEQSINLFVEKAESPEAKASAALIGTPGLSTPFATLANASQIRGLYYEPQTQRVFAVTSNILYEITSNGTATSRGTLNEVTGLTSRVSFSSNGTQVVLASNNLPYVYTLSNNTLQQLNATNFPNNGVNQPGAGALSGGVNQFEFFDTYLLALEPSTQSFFWSFVNDATDWTALQSAKKAGWPDNLIGFIENQRRLWMFGNQRGEVWYDDGTDPFARDQAGQIETGLAAQWSLHRADGAIVWLAQDEKGIGIAYKNNGYSPQRISNHAVEYQWSQFSSMSDCEAWAEQYQGHTWSVFYFPTGDQTWVYDHSTGGWHQRAWLDPVNGGLHAHLGRNHVYAFGKHLMGDRSNGNIYTASLDTFLDNGNPIRRVRACPVFQERKWLFFKKLTLYVTSGQGLSSGQGSAPIVNLRTSDDGGFTWGNEIPASLGPLGQYNYRTEWIRLGRSNDRVFEVSTSEPIPISITEAYLDAA